jgi:hypothetical protein
MLREFIYVKNNNCRYELDITTAIEALDMLNVKQ